ncbi:MAG: transposase [Tannerella sp.]|nr:transposase [Tannerella sp.]
MEQEVENSTPAIRSSLRNVLKRYGKEAPEVLICAEYTGQYGYPPGCACEELCIDLWMENAMQIKHSSGLDRGKNDRLDARKTAAYAIRFQDKVRLFSLPQKNPATLKQPVGERDMYMCDKGKYQGQLTDRKRFMNPDDYRDKARRVDRMLKELEAAIDEIEAGIRNLTDSDKTLKRRHELLLSIDGTGERTAVKMTVETGAFRNFDSARRFCCHAGVAPFKYDSGSSVRSRSKVSSRADKSIKALLHMAALCVATRTKGELHDYYLRKVAKGKNKMLIINAVRGKLVLRMFAVIKNNSLYERNYAFCLHKS